MAQVFQSSENSFYRCIRSAQKVLSQPVLNSQQLKDVQENLQEADAQLIKMDMEYRNYGSMQMKGKIDTFKTQLRKYKRQLSEQQQRLKQYQSEQASGHQFDQRQNNLNPLIQAKQKMYQNEALSNEAALRLQGNTTKLVNQLHKMDDINNQLTVAHGLLNSIQRKFIKNKLVLYGTLIIIFITVCLIIYSYFK